MREPAARSRALRLIGDIERQELGLAARVTDGERNGSARALIQIRDEHMGARLREDGRNGRANARACAGDEGKLVLEGKHGCSE